MRLVVLALFVIGSSFTAPAVAQGLLAKPTVQHAAVAGSTSAPGTAPGGTLTLWADVTPQPAIHIYAAGARDFTPVSLALTPGRSMKAGRPTYPKPDVATAPGSLDAVPAYKLPFRIAVPVTIAPTAKAGETLTITGAVTYQACDDHLCYPVAVAPITWQVPVR